MPPALTRARAQRAEGELAAAAATWREAIAAGAGGEGPFLLSALGRVELARFPLTLENAAEYRRR